MRNLGVAIALAVGVALDASAPDPALGLDYDQARALAASARAKARAARVSLNPGTQLTGLEAELGRAVSECATGPEGAPCRAVLRFTLGTLTEYHAEAEPAERARWLGRAIAQYEAILAEASDHAPTLHALATVYVRLGDAARAEAVLVDAVRRHPEQDGLAVLLGDHYLKARRWEDGLGAFALAAARNSTAELPRRRMVQCHVELLPQKLAQFRKTLRELEPTFPAAAEGGYRALIARLQPTDRPSAEAALLRLVSVLAASRRLTPSSLDGLPPTWPPVAELRTYLETPDRAPVTSWWRNPLERRHGLSEAALALGHQAALEGDAPGAAARWEVGRRISPEYDDYVFGSLRGFPVVRLDLQTALALHYFKFPSLDPGERKFNDVVQDLFRSKAGAYAAGDLAGIQRHHIVLGTIFAQKKAWGRPDQIDGALFQLDRALRAAAERDRREGTFQPLPEVRALFAEALQATGNRVQARVVAVDAGQSYLDTDGLPEAGRLLLKARGLTQESQPPQQARITELQAILETREVIAGATGARLDPSSAEYAFKADGPHGWLFGRAMPAVATDFLGRQRFKALSDLADRARAEGRPGIADGLALRAFKIAVQDVRALTGANDLVRIERVRKHATQQKVVDFRPLTLDRVRAAGAPPPGTPPGKRWILTDAPGGQPAYVRVEREDLVAAQVVGEFSGEPAAERPDFRVSNGQVVLPAGAQADRVKGRIEGLPGVGGVVVEPSLPAAVPRK
jgi:tetratricopeptide (TPR) repeat protein